MFVLIHIWIQDPGHIQKIVHCRYDLIPKDLVDKRAPEKIGFINTLTEYVVYGPRQSSGERRR